MLRLSRACVPTTSRVSSLLARWPLASASPLLAASPRTLFCAAATASRALPRPPTLYFASPLRELLSGGVAAPLALRTAVCGGKTWAPRRAVKWPRKFKLKTHKGAAKRFKMRGDGRFVHWAVGRQHLLAGASRSRQTLKKRGSRVLGGVAQQKKLRKLMPYGDKYTRRRVRTPDREPRPTGHKAETGRMRDSWYTAKVAAARSAAAR